MTLLRWQWFAALFFLLTAMQIKALCERTRECNGLRYRMWMFASWPNYPHCAEIQFHAHRVVAWPNGIVYQVIWATFWHAYVMFWLNSLSPRIYRFAQKNPFSFLRSEQIRRSVKPLFAVSGNNARLLPSIMPYTIETVWLPKPQDHMSESSVLYSLHVLHSKQQTHHDSRHWPRLCTGSVSDSHQRLTTAVVRGCNHFQMLFFCGRTNK